MKFTKMLGVIRIQSMKSRIGLIKTRKILPRIFSLLLSIAVLFGSSSLFTLPAIAASNAAEITSYSLPEEVGAASINSGAATIGVTVPYGTSVTTLAAIFTTSADITSIKVGGTDQISNTTANDFTNPITYTVTAEDGTTTKDWVVTVTIASASNTAEITSYSLSGEVGAASINSGAATIGVTVPYGTSVTARTAMFATSAGITSIKVGGTDQVSNTTANDFTNPITYTVIAEDGITTKDWVVTVTIAPASPAKAIISFNLTTPAATGDINQNAHTIGLLVPFGTNVTALVPTIAISGASVFPASGAAQNFTHTVVYTVTAADASTQTYTVIVTVATLSTYALPITINGSGSVSKNPDQASYNSGTSVTLTATPAAGFHFTGWSFFGMTIYGGNPPSPTDNPVTIAVLGDYNIAVNFSGDSSAKAITGFHLPIPAATGVIHEGNHTIALTVPFGTDVTALVPTITITGASIAPTSGVAQDFTNPVVYTVTAADASTQTYTVTVSVASNPAKAIISFNLTTPAATGVINEGAHTIALTVPFGTDVTALVPTITDTGFSVAPTSGVAQDFTNPVVYTVTAADASTQTYTVTVSVAPNPAKAITAFNLTTPAATGDINQSAHTIGLLVPFGTDVTALVPTITITGASVSPASGAAQDFTNPLVYTVTAADASTQTYNVTVTVAPATYTLMVNATGNGTVSYNPQQTTYDSGAVVQLTPHPSTGWTFSGWSGDATGTDNPVSITMNGNKSVTATFTQITYTLGVGVNIAGSGTITTNPNQVNYNAGTSIQLTATPATGYSFSSWSGSGDLSSTTANPTTIILNGNDNVTANFIQNPRSLKVIINGSNSAGPGGQVTPDQGSYTVGASVVLTATPTAGWSFTGWSSSVPADLSSTTTNPATITMNADETVTANFVQDIYTLTTHVNATDGVDDGDVVATLVSGANPTTLQYTSWSQVKLTAYPRAGWTFTGWSGALNGTSNPANIIMSDNLTVTATFAVIPKVTTDAETIVGANSFTLNGNITDLGGSPTVNATYVAFEWGTGTDYGNITTTQKQSTTGAFSFTITGIAAGTTYHYRAVAIGDGTGYGADMHFTMPTVAANPDGWWNTSWDYRAEVSIGAGTYPSDYQISLSVPFSSDKMQANFGDIRFVAADNATVLSYWMTDVVPSTSATFWIKIPSIAASGTTKIYMYYGNLSANTTSNIHTTFIFGDDFNDPAFTAAHIYPWNGGAASQGVVIDNGKAQWEMSGDNTNTNTGNRAEPIAEIYDNGNLMHFPENYIAEDDVKTFVPYGNVFFNGRYIDVNWKYEQLLDFQFNQVVENKVVNTVWTELGSAPLGYTTAVGTWYQLKAVVLGAGSATTLETYINGVQFIQDVIDSSLPSDTYYGLAFLNFSVDHPFHAAFRDVRVRQYAESEPTVSLGTFSQNNPEAAQSTLMPTSSNITADGVSTQILTVTAKDSKGSTLNIGGANVTITKLSGTGTISSVTDHDNGTYTAIVTSPTASGEGIFVATLNNEYVENGSTSHTQTQVIVNYGAGTANASQSTLTADKSNIPADGVSTDVLTVTVKDSKGIPLEIGGANVTITKSSGTGTISSVYDHDNGTYTATVTSPTASGEGTFVATYNGEYVGGTDSQTQATVTVTYSAVVTNVGGFGGGGAPALPPSAPVNGVSSISVYDIVTASGEFRASATLTSSDSKAVVSIDAGTVGTIPGGWPLNTITVTSQAAPPAPPDGSNIVGVSYDFGPNGATFNPPIHIKITYDPAKIPAGVPETSLILAFYNTTTGQWVTLPGGVVDTVAHTITVPVSHFTQFAAIAPAQATTTPTTTTPTSVIINEQVTTTSTTTTITPTTAPVTTATTPVTTTTPAINKLAQQGTTTTVSTPTSTQVKVAGIGGWLIEVIFGGVIVIVIVVLLVAIRRGRSIQ